jgi:hypothetical protein
MLRIITILLFSFIPIASISQTDHSPQLSVWKSEFSKQELVVPNYNTISSFTLNADPKASDAKANVLVDMNPYYATNCFKKKINHCATNHLPA